MIHLPENKAIVLFDGVCNLCSSSVLFISKHDKSNYFLFAALQSSAAKELAITYKIDTSQNNSVILIEQNKVFTKSTAALLIARKLNRLYPLCYGFIIIPSFIRNFVYDYVAGNRYKWFGKKEECMIPDEKLKSRFIE